MVNHENEMECWSEVSREVHTLRQLTQELHDVLVSAIVPKPEGTIIRLRIPQVENAPQIFRVRSKA